MQAKREPGPRFRLGYSILCLAVGVIVAVIAIIEIARGGRVEIILLVAALMLLYLGFRTYASYKKNKAGVVDHDPTKQK